MKFLKTIKIIIFIYLLFGLLIYSMQDLLIFPTVKYNITTAEKTITIKNKGVELKGWVINKEKENAIIYFGGNHEGVGRNIELFKKLFPNYAVYLIDYRGYGNSTGRPSEQNLYDDALHIYDLISKNHKTISLIGRSLGSAVAIYLASQRYILNIALITPFDSVENLVKNTYFMYPTSLMLKHKFESLKNIKKIKAKTLVIIATNDKIVPIERTNKLIANFDNIDLTVETINNSHHNNIMKKLATKKAILKLFK